MVDMQSKLALVLLNRGVIRQGTTLAANQKVRGLSCTNSETVLHTFVITAARLQNGECVIFETLDPEQLPCRIRSEDVIMLDGMLIDRIALAQNLTCDGIELAKRSRRGRRKKTEFAPAFA